MALKNTLEMQLFRVMEKENIDSIRTKTCIIV